MASYIGTATSRVDGRAKVTGEARYAGEFNVPNLVQGYVVGSTIPKGHIGSIDTSEALRVPGVVDVLTHQHRPPMPDSDDAYKDDVAPEKGSPYRPLYDGRILFSGQPVTLVLAEDWETARFAATLVRVDYRKEPHVTDLHAQRSKAFIVEKPEKPSGAPGREAARSPSCSPPSPRASGIGCEPRTGAQPRTASEVGQPPRSKFFESDVWRSSGEPG